MNGSVDRSIQDLASFDFVLACFCVIDAQPRGKLFRRDRFERVLAEGYTTAGSTWTGQEFPGTDDLLIRPDISSIRPIPLLEKTAWVACNIFDGNGPSPICARSHLQKHLSLVTTQRVYTGVEIEFSLGPNDTHVGRRAIGNSLALQDAPSVSRYLDALRKLLVALPIEEPTLHNEGDPGQYELTWRHADPLTTADSHFYLRYILMLLSTQTDTALSFMPLRTTNCHGNGCHVHISFVPLQESAALRQQDYARVLCQQAPEFSALTLPTINSLKRMRMWFGQKLQRSEAPQVVKFLDLARGELVRTTRHGTTEYRISDASANPYVLQCVVLSPFLQHASSTEAAQQSQVPSIPRFAYESILMLSKSSIAIEIFGREFIAAFLKWRLKELDSFYQNVTDWETGRFEPQRL